jgi:hypothetical protein
MYPRSLAILIFAQSPGQNVTMSPR